MASIKLKAAQQTARVQRSFNGAYSKQSSPADEDWDMPDMYDMQQSVTTGWSAVRQAVVNNAPTSFPTAFSNSSATSAATSSYGRQPLAPAKNAQEKPKHVETGSAGSSLWGKITDAVNQGWDTHVTNRDEIGKPSCHARSCNLSCFLTLPHR